MLQKTDSRVEIKNEVQSMIEKCNFKVIYTTIET